MAPGPPVSRSLWAAEEHLVEFISRHHHRIDCSYVCFNVSLSSTQHLWNIRMLHNNRVKSKIQATHVELWGNHMWEEKNNPNLYIIFLLKAVNVLEATWTI